MKITVHPANEAKYTSDVSSMKEIREILGGEHEIVKLLPKKEEIILTISENFKTDLPSNNTYPAYKGVVITTSEDLIWDGAFYD